MMSAARALALLPRLKRGVSGDRNSPAAAAAAAAAIADDNAAADGGECRRTDNIGGGRGEHEHERERERNAEPRPRAGGHDRSQRSSRTFLLNRRTSAGSGKRNLPRHAECEHDRVRASAPGLLHGVLCARDLRDEKSRFACPALFFPP